MARRCSGSGIICGGYSNDAPFCLIAALAGGIFAPFMATGQILCAPHARIVGVLEKDYQERKVAEALSDAGALIEVFVSERRSWTIVFTIPGGPSCVMSGGDGWEFLTPSIPRDES